MKTHGPYVIQNLATGNYYREPAPNARHGTWHQFASNASMYIDKARATHALSALRAKFTRINRGGLNVVPAARCPVMSGNLFAEVPA